MLQDKRTLLCWQDLSDVRGQLYGLAIVSIMVFHYVEWASGSAFAGVYNTIIGSIGVDVFVLLSGYSIYHSLNKSFDLHAYYIRRAKRVLVPYVVAAMVFWAVKDLWLLQLPPSSFIRDLLFVSFVADGVRTVWYVPFIAGMYAIAPGVYQFMKRGCPASALVCLWLLLCAGIQTGMPGFFEHTEVALLRVPAFLLGMGCGGLAQRRQDVPAWVLVVLGAAVPLKFALVAPGQLLGRTLNVLYGGSLIALAVTAYKGMATLTHAPRKSDVLERAGALSYELYLSHVMLRNYLATAGVDLTSLPTYLLCIAVSVPAAIALSQLQRLR